MNCLPSDEKKRTIAAECSEAKRLISGEQRKCGHFAMAAASQMLVYRRMMNDTVNTSRKHILLVDDDPAARESIKLLLNIDRHTVTEAADGSEALELFKAGKYDLVIADYFMPGMHGDELAQNIWLLAPEQRVLIMTAYFEKLLAAGKPADAMLGKPLSVDELRRAVALASE